MSQRDELVRFREDFKALTGVLPFPWQEDLYLTWFSRGTVPSSCSLGTGLGKTSVVAIWLLAIGHHPRKLPRRLVYVVNRRTVVDQTTDEVEKLRINLLRKPELQRLRNALGGMCVSGCEEPLAISTLRGQFADNREWSADPTRPAVIVGTVDMIGSRLLFSGYSVGFRAKPLHAGFLGQDALIVHDEAHLEPAFQQLLGRIKAEQKRCQEFKKLEVMELTATTRGTEQSTGSPFTLTQDDHQHPVVKQRLEACKRLHLEEVRDESDVARRMADLALRHKTEHAAVLVFVRSVEDVNKVCERLTKEKDGVPEAAIQQLTGTMRGFERDALAHRDAVFMRFLPEKNRNSGVQPHPGTVYLVCTSAGEVGIDISADHMVCDLSTFESMAQRFGRVNRYGFRTDTSITAVFPAQFDEDKFTTARKATLNLLGRLRGDASPKALADLSASLTEEERSVAFAPPPVVPHATDILFDAWALTSIREVMPGRPPVEPYLHGLSEWEPPETHVAWREEVEIITGELLNRYPPAELLDDFPLLPHELLRDRSDRVFKQLQVLAARNPDKPAWLLDPVGAVELVTLAELADTDQKNRIEGKTIVLPPSAGGLSSRGTLDGRGLEADDVADEAIDESGGPRRKRVWDNDPIPKHLILIRTIDLYPDDDEPARLEGENLRQFWHWCDQPVVGGRTSSKVVFWDSHVDKVVEHAEEIVSRLTLPKDMTEAIILAAKLHDHGKKRKRFQVTVGNHNYPRESWAKSGGRAAARFPETFRHEFASVLDAQTDVEFGSLSPHMQDLVLHLIAAHHGRARPHFHPDEAFDPERPLSEGEALTLETPRRFVRLQRRFGRWGLAYLESILRAADWAASAAEAKATP